MIKRNKRAIMELPFGVIFSIILIIAFIVVAFYVIKYFLCTGDQAKAGLFIQDFTQDVNDAWHTTAESVTREYYVPRAEFVCFMDFSKSGKGKNAEIYEKLKKYEQANMFLYPKSSCSIFSNQIEHLDLERITANNNPNCFKVENKKVKIKIVKGAYDKLVCLGECESEGSYNNSNSSSENNDFCGTSTLASCSSDSDCNSGGCSSQVCEGKNEDKVTTCEYKACYDAYKYGLSCKCSSGKCKWA